MISHQNRAVFSQNNRAQTQGSDLLATHSLLGDTENVKHFQHFKNLSIFVDDEKATQGKTVVSPPTIRVYNLAGRKSLLKSDLFFLPSYDYFQVL